MGAAVGRLGAASEVYIVPDVSAVLDQTDVLLSGLPPFKDILFLETVLDEVRVTSGKIYNRVKDALLKDDQSTANYAIFRYALHNSIFSSQPLFLCRFPPPKRNLLFFFPSSLATSTIVRRTWRDPTALPSQSMSKCPLLSPYSGYNNTGSPSRSILFFSQIERVTRRSVSKASRYASRGEPHSDQ